MAESAKKIRFSDDAFFTVSKAALRLDCHPCTLRRAIVRGDLEIVRIGRAIRIAESALKRYINRRKGR